MTKRDREMMKSAYSEYKKSNISEIESAYKTSPSVAKKRAYSFIWFYMHDIGGKHLRVIHAGIHTFTCGFTVTDSDGKEWFYYFLPTRHLVMEISDILSA